MNRDRSAFSASAPTRSRTVAASIVTFVPLGRSEAVKLISSSSRSRTMHRGAGDYRPDERRVMLRTIVYPN